ncbi:MAG: threonine synthase [Blastocatellia bacterium AA13]|nr:MAG: threonine synthase [Blastocatellia bacterium AA13]
MSFVNGLRCRECGREYPKAPIAGCEDCFAPLEVDYDYAAISKALSREEIASRDFSLWRYHELLPLDGEPVIGRASGATPLIRADRLARELGIENLYIKNDSVNFPTLSFKDRVTAVAINKAIEFKLEAVGCASTGNLANSVAANAAAAGLPSYIFIPDNLEKSKVTATQVYGARVIAVKGNYDQVNRLCSEIADRYPWGLVNVNLRPFYGEGSKTFGYEIAEQLGWIAPDAVVVPMAGGSLISKIHKGLREFEQLGLLKNEVSTRMFGAQAAGCNPIVAAVKRGSTEIQPVKPQTIAKSLAIGNPADGYHAASIISASGGWAEDATDEEIIAGIRLLAETQGIFTETAGGVTLAAAQKLIKQGRIKPNDLTVIAITGNGLKTQEAVEIESPAAIEPNIADFERAIARAAAV